MKTIFLLLLLFAGKFGPAQGNKTSVKRIDTIHSSILKEDRYIWVQTPERISSKRYPVIYLLDGEIHFDEVNNILGKLSKESGKNISNEVIVVGIGNISQRYRDYSPTRITSSPWVDDHTAKTTGGGKAFISFLEKELLPHIKSTCPSSSDGILIGHSMGGLAVMDILLKHTNMFEHYAAIDPSMWWDDEKLLQESEIILANKSFEKKSLFLAVANTMEKNMDINGIRKDTTSKTALILPSLLLVDYIMTNRHDKLQFQWKFYKDDHHMTVPSPAMYDAIKYFLTFL
jgi:uncharacterized protein